MQPIRISLNDYVLSGGGANGESYDHRTDPTIMLKLYFPGSLTQAICTETGRDEYLELRKSRKSFMIDPVGVEVTSITTHGKQELWIGREKYARFRGKTLCFLDDVVSTGGTIDAAMELTAQLGIRIGVIACALLEGERRDSYKGIPLVSLDWIPLPGPACAGATRPACAGATRDSGCLNEKDSGSR